MARSMGLAPFVIPGGLMPTFAQPTPLTERILNAKRSLEEARTLGQQPLIEAAERVLNGLIDRLPRRDT